MTLIQKLSQMKLNSRQTADIRLTVQTSTPNRLTLWITTPIPLITHINPIPLIKILLIKFHLNITINLHPNTTINPECNWTTIDIDNTITQSVMSIIVITILIIVIIIHITIIGIITTTTSTITITTMKVSISMLMNIK
jgi:hypothetical protein